MNNVSLMQWSVTQMHRPIFGVTTTLSLQHRSPSMDLVGILVLVTSQVIRDSIDRSHLGVCIVRVNTWAFKSAVSIAISISHVKILNVHNAMEIRAYVPHIGGCLNLHTHHPSKSKFTDHQSVHVTLCYKDWSLFTLTLLKYLIRWYSHVTSSSTQHIKAWEKQQYDRYPIEGTIKHLLGWEVPKSIRAKSTLHADRSDLPWVG